MDPGFKIVSQEPFQYAPLKKKKSNLKYPKHKRSSRLCLIAADRDSLKDLKNQPGHSHSLESKKSKQIQILNCTNDSEFPIEYKLNRSQKNLKDLSLGKIVINKSSRIRDRKDSHSKIVTSEVFSMSHCPNEENVYWTMKRGAENASEANPGYSTLNRSRVIEVSYFPTNHNGQIFGELDSAPKKFFQEKPPSPQNQFAKEKQRKSLVPRVAKTSLSEFSHGSDQMIQDFLDQQQKANKKKSFQSIKFKNKPQQSWEDLSMENEQSKNISSMQTKDQKQSTGFTFNIFDKRNIVKSEIFDTNKKNNIFLNFESERRNEDQNSFFLSEFEQNPSKNYTSIQKKKGDPGKATRKVKKNATRKKLKMMKTPKREKIFEKPKIKSKTQVLEKRYTKSNIKAAKKKRNLGKKNFGIVRHSVNLNPKESVKDPFKLKITRKKKKSRKKEKFEQSEYNRTLPVNKISVRGLASSRQFKRSGLRHQRTLSGVTGVVGNLNLTRKAKEKPVNRTFKKTEFAGSLYLKKGKSKSIKMNPKKTLRISTKKAKQRKVSRKTEKMIETPIFKNSTKKMSFDRPI